MAADGARLAPVLQGLRSEAELRSVGRALERSAIPVMALKGPSLQRRLYGTPAAYRSGDIDVLVARRDWRRARSVLNRDGWSFSEHNSVLWRLSRAASLERESSTLDLHWGLHAAHLPGFALRPLERALWAGARRGPDGLLEPDPESLLVFLAVHVVGHGFERPQWLENVGAAARLVRSWDRVWEIARDARVEGAVRKALEGRASSRPPVLDGARGRLLWAAAWVGRGHFLPQRWRDGMRARVGAMRRPRHATFAGLDLEVGRGVFPPMLVSEGLVRLSLRSVEGVERPVVVDVGTGSGAVALAVARARADAEVHATDVSRRALRVAARNRRRLGLPAVRFHRGSLLAPLPAELPGRVDVVISNVPYVPPANMPAEMPFPRRVIEGLGTDGLDLPRALAQEARRFLRPGGSLVVQLADQQWNAFAEDLAGMGYGPVDPEERRPGRAVVGWAEWRGDAR